MYLYIYFSILGVSLIKFASITAFFFGLSTRERTVNGVTRVVFPCFGLGWVWLCRARVGSNLDLVVAYST